MTATKRDGKWHIGIEDAFDPCESSFVLLPEDCGSEEGAKAAAKTKRKEFKKNAKGGTVWDQVYIVKPDGSRYLFTDKIPVFVWNKNPGQVGGGYYSMVVCFRTLGVHVFFKVSLFNPSRTVYCLETVVESTLCDGSCRHAFGFIDDFSEERRPGQYPVKPLIDAALAFRK